MQTLWIATTNAGKTREFAALLEPLEFQVRSLKDLSTYFPPAETGSTFLENARIKAKSLKAMRPGDWILADDSGLEVAGLGGLPGVHSARYAGPKATDAENMAKLVKMLNLKAVVDRSARFVSSLVIFNPTGEEMNFEGELKGVITSVPKGKDGFGYDPLFIPEGESKTLAELGLAYKNSHSHRARALKKFLDLLAAQKSSG